VALIFSGPGHPAMHAERSYNGRAKAVQCCEIDRDLPALQLRLRWCCQIN
jgi:hypothetical protein